jgi:Na+-driven multidrug efflux pump
MDIRRKRVSNPDFLLVVTILLPIFAEQFASVFLAALSNMVSSNIDTNIINVTTLVSGVVSLPAALYGCIASGTAILMSHDMGAGDTVKARRLFTTSMHLGILVALFVSLLVILFGQPLLRAVYPKMSQEFFELGRIYTIFISVGFPIGFYQANCIGIMRSSLNTKGAFLISMSVAIVDLAFKAFFMLVLDMGILGLCLASLISKAYSLVVCTIVVKKSQVFNGCLFDFKPFVDRGTVKDILRIGVVMCAEAFVAALGGVILGKILADMGDLQVTGFTLSQSMQSLLTVLPISIALVAQIVAGRYKGAGDDAYALKLSMKLTFISFAIHMIFAYTSLLFVDKFVLLYTKDAATIGIIIRVYRAYVFSMPFFWAFGNVLSAGIRGYGNVRQPALTIIICLWVFKIPATYIAVSVLDAGAVGRVLVQSIEMALYAASFLGYYFLELHRIKKREHQKNTQAVI